MDLAKDYVAALAPSTGLGILFWLLMRSMLRADRSERAALRRERDNQARATSHEEPRP